MRDLDYGKVFLVGTGPGDPGHMTVKARDVLERADTVVYDRTVPYGILALARPGAEHHDLDRCDAGSEGAGQDAGALLVSLASGGHRVARLRGGDPLTSGHAGPEAAALNAAGVPFEIVPGITAAQGAAASAEVPLTLAGRACGLHYVDGDAALAAEGQFDWRALAGRQTTLAISVDVRSVGEVALQLMRHGMPAGIPAMAVSAPGTAHESRIVTRLCHLSSIVAARELEPPTLFIVGEVIRQHKRKSSRSVSVHFA